MLAHASIHDFGALPEVNGRSEPVLGRTSDPTRGPTMTVGSDHRIGRFSEGERRLMM